MWGQRFARLVTNVVVRIPAAWRLLRGPLRRQFDRLAPEWHTRVKPEGLAAFEQALDTLERPPARVLDLGTGTGRAAFALARRFPQAQVVGADLSDGMLEIARRDTPSDLAARVRFDAADASALPYEDATYDLVALVNMIPFFDELARVVASGGHALFGFSRGAETPIWVPPERLRRELTRRGFGEVAEFGVGESMALLARKR